MKTLRDGDTIVGYRIDYRDRNGKRYRKTYRRQKDAERALRKHKDAIDEGTFVAPRAVPTFSDAAEAWFRNKLGKRPSTVMQYRGHLDNHLLPTLGNMQLSDISVDRIETLRDELLADRKKRLGPGTVKKILTTASAVFKAAIKKGKWTMNPAALADRPDESDQEIGEDGEVYRTSRSRAVTADEVLSPEEICTLLEHAPTTYYRALLWVAASTGARHDEVLALRWSDVDFTEGTVRVERNLSWARRPGEAMRARFLPPKTKGGRRTVPASPELLHQLKVWKAESAYCRDSDLIFPKKNGEAQQRKTVLTDGLYPAAAAAELRRVTMHSLRHSFATALLAAGTPIPEVQSYLGHARATVTLDTYGHFLPKQRTEAVANLARRFTAPAVS